MSKLADLLENLAIADGYPEPWFIEKESHNHNDGTTHFTHVRHHTKGREGTPMTVEVASYVTPELGELLCTLHNNLPIIIRALRICEIEDAP